MIRLIRILVVSLLIATLTIKAGGFALDNLIADGILFLYFVFLEARDLVVTEEMNLLSGMKRRGK